MYQLTVLRYSRNDGVDAIFRHVGIRLCQSVPEVDPVRVPCTKLGTSCRTITVLSYFLV